MSVVRNLGLSIMLELIAPFSSESSRFAQMRRLESAKLTKAVSLRDISLIFQ